MSNCVADCCGLKAFDTSPEEIMRWVRENPAERVERAASQAAELVERISDRRYRYTSGEVNHFTCDEKAREALVEFFQDFATVLGGKVGGDWGRN